MKGRSVYYVSSDLGEVLSLQTELLVHGDDAKNPKLRFSVVELQGSPEFVVWVSTWCKKSNELGRALSLSELQLESAVPGEPYLQHLIAELLAKLNGSWSGVDLERELCHCRGVVVSRVDRAIVGGAKSVSAVSRATGAGTSCGTCQPEIQECIERRQNIRERG